MSATLKRVAAAGAALVAGAVWVPPLFSDAPPAWAAKRSDALQERSALAGGGATAATVTDAGTASAPERARRSTPRAGSLAERLAHVLEGVAQYRRGSASEPDGIDTDLGASASTDGWMRTTGPSPLDRIWERLRLRGVLALPEPTGTRWIANVDGRLVGAGDELEPGLRVHAVGEATVELALGEERRTLELDPEVRP